MCQIENVYFNFLKRLYVPIEASKCVSVVRMFSNTEYICNVYIHIFPVVNAFTASPALASTSIVNHRQPN